MIETERLILRKFIPQDVNGIYALDSDPEVHTYLGQRPIKSMEEAKAVVDSVMLQYEVDGTGRWAVIDRVSNDFVGWAGLKFEKEVWPEQHYYDLGYRLRKKYWGQGIGSEVATLWLAYGFETMQLHEICAGAHVDNVASNRILQKTGLKLRDRFFYDGDEHNWYGLLREDWEKTQGSV